MYTEIELPNQVREYLENLDVPVRVLKGNAGNFRPSRSWRGQARVNNASLEECESNGLTIVSWGTETVADWFSPPVEYVTDPPAELFADGNVPENPGKDWVIPIQPHDDALNFSIGNRIYARLGGGRTLWYHVPLDSTFGWPDNSLNLEKFFGEPIERARNYDPEADVRERQEREARQRFQQMVTGSQTRRITELERTIEQGQRDQREYEESLQRMIRQNRDSARQLEALRNYDASQDQERVESMWDALRAHPKVDGIRSEGSYIIIRTHGLDLHDPDDTNRSCYLGCFDIKIGMPGSGYGVKMRNLDNRQQEDYWDHPHVENQNACFGDIASLIGDLQANGEIMGLFEVLIQYLETYNPSDSWGSHARYWFDAARRRNANPAPNSTPDAATANTETTDDTDYDPDCVCDYCVRVTEERRRNGQI